METNFYLLFILFPKKGLQREVKAYPFVSNIKFNPDDDTLEIKCMQNERYLLKNANKIALLYFVRGTTRLDKYYYYNAKMDMFIPNDLITIGIMEFGGAHKDLENKQVLDYNMNLRHNNFKGSLGNWLTTGEALEFHDRESFKKIFMQSAEYNKEEE